MNISLPYVITGASGRTGSTAAQALLDQGHTVRVVLRDEGKREDWTRRGAEVCIADLTDLDAMSVAFSNVRGAYLVSPQEYGREDLFERADLIAAIVAKAALAARVPKIVALSSIGADRAHGTGWIAMNRMLEQHLSALDIPVALIRAVYFMENWTHLIGSALAAGTLTSFLSPADKHFPMVAAVDVGRVSASILLQDWTGMRTIELAGPEEYAPGDVAQTLAGAASVQIEVSVLPEADWRSALSTAGFSDAALRGFVELTSSINSGHIAFDAGASMEV